MSNNQKKLLILNQAVLLRQLEDTSEINVIKLKQSKSGELGSFLLLGNSQENSQELFELIAYTPEIGSAFIDNYVQSECLAYFATNFDFVYFLISLSYADKNNYNSLDQLTSNLLKSSEEHKDALQWLKQPSTVLLEEIFDTDMLNNQIRIKFNQVKCMNWLGIKVKTVQRYLSDKSKRDSDKSIVDEEKVKLEAFELVCQYLDKDLSGPLRKESQLSSPLDTNDCNKIKRSRQEIKEEIKEEIKTE